MLSIVVTNLVWAQTEAEFKRELDKILLDRQQTLEWEESVIKSRPKLELIVKENRIEMSRIEETLNNRPAQINDALKQINETLDSRPSSKRKRFYKCLRESIQSRGIALVDNCNIDHSKGFSQKI
jgi:hypothetical protein